MMQQLYGLLGCKLTGWAVVGTLWRKGSKCLHQRTMASISRKICRAPCMLFIGLFAMWPELCCKLRALICCVYALKVAIMWGKKGGGEDPIPVWREGGTPPATGTGTGAHSGSWILRQERSWVALQGVDSLSPRPRCRAEQLQCTGAPGEVGKFRVSHSW